MKTVTLGVAARDAVSRRALDAFKGRKQGAHISFAAPELLFRLLTAKRWELIRAMAGATEWRRLRNWSQKSAEKFSSFGEGATAFGCFQGGANAGERLKRNASGVRSKRNCQS